MDKKIKTLATDLTQDLKIETDQLFSGPILL
jgi:hypothetical protein